MMSNSTEMYSDKHWVKFKVILEEAEIVRLISILNIRGRKLLLRGQSLLHIGSVASMIIRVARVFLISTIDTNIFDITTNIFIVIVSIIMIMITIKVPWKPLGVRLPIRKQ